MSLLPGNIATLEDKDYEKLIATPISMIKKSQTLNKIVDLVKTYFVWMVFPWTSSVKSKWYIYNNNPEDRNWDSMH